MVRGCVWVAAFVVACAEPNTTDSRPIPTGGTLPVTTGDTGTPPAPTDSGTSPTDGCPPESCLAADLDCIGLVDNSLATTFGLRIAQLDVTAPAALATGVLGSVLADDVLPYAPECALFGGGTFNWLLEFDVPLHRVTFGGAKPPAVPAEGYTFVDEADVTPVIANGVAFDPQGQFSFDGMDVNAPVYLDQAGTQLIVLPLVGLHVDAALSEDQNCIGHYAAESLDPANDCLGSDAVPSFVTGGAMDAVIPLEAADAVVVGALGQSLCALLSGDPTVYGTAGEDGITRCARDAYGVISFPGDACSLPETTCTDAMAFAGTFAASAVPIVD